MYGPLENAVEAAKKALEALGITIERILCQIHDLVEEIAAEIRSDEIKPNTPYDFSCSCPEFLRLDLVPWYTSGFL